MIMKILFSFSDLIFHIFKTLIFCVCRSDLGKQKNAQRKRKQKYPTQKSAKKNLQKIMKITILTLDFALNSMENRF